MGAREGGRKSVRGRDLDSTSSSYKMEGYSRGRRGAT